MYGVGFGYGSAGATTILKGGGGAFDADAQSFFAAASITDLTQKNAVNQLVLDLKSNSLWTKMKALYPVVGGNATAHSYNLKDTTQYQLSFSSGWTHSNTGMLPNGVSATANTNFNPVTESLSVNSNHMSTYLRTGNSAYAAADIGQNDNQWISATWYNFQSRCFVYNPNNSYQVSNTMTNAINLSINTRRSSTDFAFFNNNSKIGTNTSTNSSSFISANVHISSAGGTSLYSPREVSFASIGNGLSDTDTANLYTCIQTFQTSLSRNV